MGDVLKDLDAYAKKGLLNTRLLNIIKDLYINYTQALAEVSVHQQHPDLFNKLLELVIKEQLQHPYQFDVFHRSIRYPFDYYQFGLDFIRPFIDFTHSKILGLDHLQKIQQQLQQGDNVILLANHQTEPDPQIISLLLEKIAPELATDMIFVAGHRVISDPLAIPMSMGRNLLCIYSKKHMNYPPDKKAEKVAHNQRTMKKMGELLNEGHRCIYVAPSGGRDRPNANGEVEVAPFDAQSIELFWLMAQQAERPTHFYPLTLRTYALMPPPKQVERELGEKRLIKFTPVYLAFGEEIDMDHFPGSQGLDKKAKRQKRAEYIWNKVCQDYATIT